MSKIRALHEQLVKKEMSAVELATKYSESAKVENDKLNAYVKLTDEYAIKTAKAVDAKIANGEEIGLLEGIPMTLKDNISTKGIETTCGSKMLENYVPIFNATCWNLLKDNGAVMLGKTNMDEFAMGSTCETSYFGGSKNPFNQLHVAGGSSGGVASAVGGNIAVYGLGTDTGGSIRQPAAFCGCVGLKPTYGAVSRYGVVAYGSSLDQVGPITTSVEDVAIVFDAIAKKDSLDSTSQGAKEIVCNSLNSDIKGKKIAVINDFLNGIKGEIKEAFLKSIKQFEELGAEILYFDLPILEYALPVYYIISCAEASSNLSRFDGIRYGYKTSSYNGIHDMICKTRSEGFGDEVKRRILLGTYVLSSGYYDAYYKKAQNLRGGIIKAVRDTFASCDIILTPTTPTTATEFGYKPKDAVETYYSDIFTVLSNIAGVPSISIPCGFDSKGLPIGIQLIANTFEESKLLNVSYAYEQATKAYKAADMGVL